MNLNLQRTQRIRLQALLLKWENLATSMMNSALLCRDTPAEQDTATAWRVGATSLRICAQQLRENLVPSLFVVPVNC